MTDIRELFEAEYADRFGMLPEEVKAARLGKDSYNTLTIARCFRFFCAGFEANSGENLRVIGYISNESIEFAIKDSSGLVSQKKTKAKAFEVYVKQIINTGDNHEQ